MVESGVDQPRCLRGTRQKEVCCGQKVFVRLSVSGRCFFHVARGFLSCEVLWSSRVSYGEPSACLDFFIGHPDSDFLSSTPCPFLPLCSSATNSVYGDAASWY